MQLTVKYFASIREAIGHGSEQVQTRAVNLQGLRDELISRGGAYAESLAHGKTVRMAMDQVMQGESTLFRDGAEIAFFPPVTGG